MPKYHKEIKTIYQGKEMWVHRPTKLQETGEIRTIENLLSQMRVSQNAIETDLR